MLLRFLLPCLLLSPCVFPGFAHAAEEETIKIPAEEGSQERDFMPNLEQVVKLIIEQTNDFRKEHDLSAVKQAPKLMETAQYFADFMAKNDLYGHYADEQSAGERAKQHEYEYCLLSENIAYRYSSRGFKTRELAEGFVTGWEESPGHRENMLEPAVTETGVAVAYSERSGHYFAVQMFGRPRSASIEFKLINRGSDVIEYQIGDRTFNLSPRQARLHTECRPPKVVVEWTGSDDKEHGRTLRPENGNTYTLSLKSGEMDIQKE